MARGSWEGPEIFLKPGIICSPLPYGLSSKAMCLRTGNQCLPSPFGLCSAGLPVRGQPVDREGFELSEELAEEPPVAIGGTFRGGNPDLFYWTRSLSVGSAPPSGPGGALGRVGGGGSLEPIIPVGTQDREKWRSGARPGKISHVACPTQQPFLVHAVPEGADRPPGKPGGRLPGPILGGPVSMPSPGRRGCSVGGDGICRPGGRTEWVLREKGRRASIQDSPAPGRAFCSRVDGLAWQSGGYPNPSFDPGGIQRPRSLDGCEFTAGPERPSSGGNRPTFAQGISGRGKLARLPGSLRHAVSPGMCPHPPPGRDGQENGAPMDLG